jgi:hypothetical protein
MVEIVESSSKEIKIHTTTYHVSKQDLIELCWGDSKNTDRNTIVNANFSCMKKDVFIDDETPLSVTVVVKSEY